MDPLLLFGLGTHGARAPGAPRTLRHRRGARSDAGLALGVLFRLACFTVLLATLSPALALAGPRKPPAGGKAPAPKHPATPSKDDDDGDVTLAVIGGVVVVLVVGGVVAFVLLAGKRRRAATGAAPAPPPAAPPTDAASGASPAVTAAIAALGGRIDAATLSGLRLQAHPSLRALIATAWEGKRFTGTLAGRRVAGLVFASGASTFDVGLGIRVATSDERALGFVVAVGDLENPDPPVLWYDFPAAGANPHGAPRGPAAPSLSAFLGALQVEPAAPAGADANAGGDVTIEDLVRGLDPSRAVGMIGLYNAGIPTEVNIAIRPGREIQVRLVRGTDPRVDVPHTESVRALAALVERELSRQARPAPAPAAKAGPGTDETRSQLPSLAAVVEHMRRRYGPPPAPARTPEAEREAARLRAEGMMRGQLGDYRGAIAGFDAAMLQVGETPDLLAARAMAFFGLEEIAWYAFDMREALDRGARGEPLSMSEAEREKHRRMLDAIAGSPAGAALALLGPRRRADTFYARAFRAWKEDRPRVALAWMAESLAVEPSALACWYGAVFLARENDAEPALFLLDLLPQRPASELAQLYDGVSRSDVTAARAAVAAIAKSSRGM